VKDTKFNRSLFQLQASVLRTEEKESGSLQSEKMWLTPSATMRDKRSPEAMKRREEYRKSIGRNTVPPGSLAEQVKYGRATTDMKMWPTPRTGGGSRPNQKGGKVLNEEVLIAEGLRERGKTLAQQQTESMWPTPQAADHLANQSETLEAWEKRAAKKKKEGINLQFALRHAVQKNPKMWPTPRASAAMSEDLNNIKERGVDKGRLEERVAQMWPTPTQRDYKGQNSLKHIQEKPRHNSQLPNRLRQQGISGSLNPTWVEWLMGYPEGYTDLKDWAILSSRKSSKK
jgi:hypothetical protein